LVAGSFPAHRYPLFALPFRKPAATGQGFSHTALVSFCSLSIHRCSCLPSLQATENMTHVINYFLLLFGCQCFFFFIGLFLLSHQHCNSPFLMRQSQLMQRPGSLWILFLLINLFLHNRRKWSLTDWWPMWAAPILFQNSRWRLRILTGCCC